MKTQMRDEYGMQYKIDWSLFKPRFSEMPDAIKNAFRETVVLIRGATWE